MTSGHSNETSGPDDARYCGVCRNFLKSYCMCEIFTVDGHVVQTTYSSACKHTPSRFVRFDPHV